MTEAPKRRGRPPKVKAVDPDVVQDAAPEAEIEAVSSDLDADDEGKPSLGQHEWAAVMRECYEAYDFQDERVRFDTQGRKWTACLDREDNEMVLAISLSRLTTTYGENISTRLLGTDGAYQHVEKAMLELDRLVR